jgi:hypothetical protein
MTPPSFPPPLIERIRFEGSASGFQTIGLDRSRLEIAQSEAQKWLATQTNIDIASIDSCFGNMGAFVTVWFRRKLS